MIDDALLVYRGERRCPVFVTGRPETNRVNEIYLL